MTTEAGLEGLRRRHARSRSGSAAERLTLVPAAEHRRTLVFLHGFQMRARHLLEDFTRLQETCPTWRFVLPQAPELPITAHGGQATPSWYDYLTDSAGAGEDLVDLAGLRVRRVELAALLRAEAALLGDDYSRLYVGGLSQGGTLALDAATRLQLGGVVTVVAPRLSVSLRQALQAPWHGLFARHDSVFPVGWARPLLRDAVATWCDADHDLEGVDYVGYLATTLQKFEAPRKDP